MSRYRGWLYGFASPVKRTGTEKSGMSTTLESLTGMSVKSFINVIGGFEHITIRVERRGRTVFDRTFVVTGDDVKVEGR